MLPRLQIDRTEMRCHVRVRGQVQGVGFRPFVYRLATELELAGWVLNDTEGVQIEVQGEAPRVRAFLERLELETPPLARIDALQTAKLPLLDPESGFRIRSSQAGPVRTGVTPDSAICSDCLMELLDPDDRRYRYPFINCTHCGPRYTITTALPYDRPNTSMGKFTLCAPCQAEYDAPLDRRFHAQPNACSVCGPTLRLHDTQGSLLTPDDVLAEAVARIREGEILAIKGVGGFHLVCDARNASAVSRLRRRKNRDEKPFAVMPANIESLAPWAECDREQRSLLESRERPIVLLRKRTGCDAAFAGIAPGIAWLGVMLPYTPLHYLLFHEAAGGVTGTDWLGKPQALVLVMTSANPGGEPLVIDNGEALQRLVEIADAFVMHDRDICVHCDDSVMRWNGQAPGFIRRARGFTPRAIQLARTGPSVLAVGGWYKNTVCLTRGDEAFLSQYIGSLDNSATCQALERTVDHLLEVLEIEPEQVAHDLHPDFFSTRFAAEFARQHTLPRVAVQHHHAHIAAVMAEHGLDGPTLGVALDGVGLGTEGGIWGGELLLVRPSDCQRIGHLHPLALPGGDRAAREPWRMAASALHALGRGAEISQRFAAPAAHAVREMLAKGINCPETSSAGRLFDAAAGLLGVKLVMNFEGQAAMMLEGLAEKQGPAEVLTEGYALGNDGVLNLLPLLDSLADIKDSARGAALFHATLSQGLVDWIEQAAGRYRLGQVVLGGGCMLNHILSRRLRESLQAKGLQVYEARQAPPNDGGLSLGQAWVTICRDVA